MDAKYILAIEQPIIPKPNTNEQACYPFDFTFQLSSVAGGPIIRYVEPPSNTQLDPTRDVYIQIHFSEPIYTDENKAITRDLHADTLKTAVYLQQARNGTIVRPKEVRSPSTDHADDLTMWLLIFAHDDLKYSTQYILHVDPAKLYSESHASFSLPSEHIYTTTFFDTSCSGYGIYDPEFQICICNADTHRKGITCELCEDGYQPDAKKVCIPVDTCLAETCGCLPRAHPTDPCQPIGECIENPGSITNHITCKCPPRYSGPHCGACAEGYGNYPTCTMDCKYACLHGSCVPSVVCTNATCVNSTSCVCAQGYAGFWCNKCSNDYTGYPVCVKCSPPCMHGKCVPGNRCVCEDGWIGSECGRLNSVRGSLTPLVTLVIVLVVLAAIGVVIAVAWHMWKRAHELEYVDPKMELELEGGKKFGGGDEDSSIGLGDEDDDGHLEIPSTPFADNGDANDGGDDSGDDLIT
eukprot:TRINITY_DN3851_c0_g1_i1.p1 TRINITY_DN3851_c0_g1~~TRINITY_DN3851_c0_g1_i1.p1  ORF type:complete len:466 (+),score=72.96 TRINITY_DN3851_c0_g1_i1:124-1521(+)